MTQASSSARQELQGKCCLITGAAQGIGLAVAGAFHAAGARIIATDINPNALKQAALHAEIVQRTLDVTDAAQCAAVAREFPGVNVIVNCAGYVATGDVLGCEEADFARSLEVNVWSIFRVVKAFLPMLLERGDGSIVNIASVVSTTKAAPKRFAYATTKGAVLAMTRSLALDFVGRGIRCNSISPGTVDTPSLQQRINASADPGAAREQLVLRQPMGRLGRPEEIAAAAVFLASDAGRFMTGADVIIDGGMSL